MFIKLKKKTVCIFWLSRDSRVDEMFFVTLYWPSEADSRPGAPILPFSFLPNSRPIDDLMLFFLLALWRESWLAVVTPSAERLQRKRTFSLLGSPLAVVLLQKNETNKNWRILWNDAHQNKILLFGSAFCLCCTLNLHPSCVGLLKP